MNLYLLYKKINALIISCIITDFIIELIVIFIKNLYFRIIIFTEIREKVIIFSLPLYKLRV